MPIAAPRPCTYPGCGVLVRGGARCEAHRRAETKRLDADRGTSSQRGYGYKWQRAREAYLQAHPLCVRCAAKDRVVAATVVDHIIPHKGDMTLFWNSGNWQPLCKPCHDLKTATEDGGFATRKTGATLPGGGG
jgi:5-methylcytosine-specific restriction protein A